MNTTHLLTTANAHYLKSRPSDYKKALGLVRGPSGPVVLITKTNKMKTLISRITLQDLFIIGMLAVILATSIMALINA